jgi:hypothetical protein
VPVEEAARMANSQLPISGAAVAALIEKAAKGQ